MSIARSTLIDISLIALVSMIFLPQLASCNKSPPPESKPIEKNNLKSLPKVELVHSSGRMFQVYVTKSAEEQTLGLSGIKSQEFSDQEGMLFFYEKDSPHSFWMPDTYFDLDIFFLDQDLKVLDVERKVAAHPGRETPPEIAKTRTIISRHVLELKSGPTSQAIQIGDKFILRSGAL